MARTYSDEQRRSIPEGRDVWQMAEAVDGYLRTKTGPSAPVRIDVFDARGHITGDSLFGSKTEWESDRHPIDSLIATYGREHGDETWVRVHAQNLGRSRGSVLAPTLVVRVTGPDPGDVRGTALEVIERAGEGKDQAPSKQARPRPTPVVSAPVLMDEPSADSSEPPAPAPRTRLHVVVHNVWFVALISGVIASLIGAYLWTLVT